MSLDSSSIIADVKAAIADIGFAVIVTRKPTDDLPWAQSADRMTFALQVIDTKRWLKRNADSEVQQGRSIICAPGGLVPVIGDEVLIRGETCEVIDVRPLSPSGVDLAYVMDLQ